MAKVIHTADQLNFTKIVVNAESVGLTPNQFVRLCSDNPDLEFELTARKEIVIMPPSTSETGWGEGELFGQLREWAKRDRTGLAFPPSAGFRLPNGATRAPDAAWIRRGRWTALASKDRKTFAPVCPDFVIEVKSRRNTMAELHAKMREYLENGSRMGFLIQPGKRQVFIYRQARQPEQLNNPTSVTGDPELPGFTLDLTEIWEQRD